MSHDSSSKYDKAWFDYTVEPDESKFLKSWNELRKEEDFKKKVEKFKEDKMSLTKELASGVVPEDIEKYYKVIDTGEFNCYLAYEKILIDVGVPFYKVKDYVKDLEAIFLTHRHSDHINFATLRRIRKMRPAIPIYIGAWLKPLLDEEKVTGYKIIEPGFTYQEGDTVFMPFATKHDVPNVGYFIYNREKGKTIFHATDLGDVEGLSAYNADIVALEFNHDASMIDDLIEREIKDTGFSHYMQSRYNHLSFQKAREFVETKTKGEDEITLIKLHTSEFFQIYLKDA